MKASTILIAAALLVGAVWWWRKRKEAAAKSKAPPLSTAGQVAVLKANDPPALAVAAGIYSDAQWTNMSPAEREKGMARMAALATPAPPLDPVGLGTTVPPNVVNGSPPPPAPPAQPKVDSAKPAPKKPTTACAAGKGWKLTKVGVGKTSSFPSGSYNQWQCR